MASGQGNADSMEGSYEPIGSGLAAEYFELQNKTPAITSSGENIIYERVVDVANESPYETML